jgi:hypothetical protein
MVSKYWGGQFHFVLFPDVVVTSVQRIMPH